MLCASLDGRGVCGRMNTCICMAEFLHCSPETTATLLISYIPIQNKILKFEKEKNYLVPNVNNAKVLKPWERERIWIR